MPLSAEPTSPAARTPSGTPRASLGGTRDRDGGGLDRSERGGADGDWPRAVAQRLESSIGAHKYGLWFERQTRFEARQGALEVAASSKLVADWIGRHYG
ncbi:MAG: hypothetical protein FGM37_02535, partial [Phycisphaerales bacterium]|nr:hypothetical protein [Phycisphaerales bacterium]